jgi:uncharacterized glyoxalase superfamily protein PhnB
MAKAVGIGGVFLHFLGEEQELKDWYQDNLGFDMTDYGTGFVEGRQLVLLSFKRGKKPDTPYLNIRVDDIKQLMKDLPSKGAVVINDTKEYDYGFFSTIKDPFGNVLELWEVKEEAYIKMVEKEVQDYKNKHKKSDE